MLDYLRGLATLRELLPPGNPSAQEQFTRLETRLRENLDERRYGPDGANTAQLNRIIEAINAFMLKDLHLDSHFIDLCTSMHITVSLPGEQHNEGPPQTLQHSFELWQEGEALSIQGQEYWIEGPITRQWSKQNAALSLQAPGRHGQTGQRAWLKQCQVSRSQETALTLKRDLEKEGRLLLQLQQAGQRDFPRLLGSEGTTYSATLAYERLAGRSLMEALKHTSKPFDSHAVRRLLAGRHTLIQMLHTLHTRMRCAHRMLTPETLLLQPGSNRILLADVGLAARTIQPGEGPQFYQAPEQLRGLPVPGRATDIYQLGALFYFLLTGHSITDASTIQTACLDPELERLLRRASAPIPQDRWPTVYAFSQALRQLGY